MLVAMSILAIVFVAWFEIIGVQSARREARRREAVERLAGMMDAFMECYRDKYKSSDIKDGFYAVNGDTMQVSKLFTYDKSDQSVKQMFPGDISSIGYRLNVVKISTMEEKSYFQDWKGTSTRCLVGELFDRSEDVAASGKPFLTLRAFLWF